MSRTTNAARPMIRVSRVERALPRRQGRSKTELELAERMLEKLRAGHDIRPERIAAARHAEQFGQLDDPAKLDVALDRLIDRLEGDAI